MTYKIEKNVAMPSGKIVRTYPFADLKVGDSFFVPNGARDASKVRMTLQNAAGSYKRNEACEGWGFATRALEGGTRLWRVS